MKIGGPRIFKDQRANLTLNASEILEPRISFSFAGQATSIEDWNLLLSRPEVAQLWMLCGLALEAAQNPNLKRPLSNRFLDAILWFGQAVREDSRAAAVTKCVTALERMFMTDERDDICETLSRRISTICYSSYKHNITKTIDEWKEDVKVAYNLRSKLLHGSLSPTSLEAINGVYKCIKISELAIRAGLMFFGERQLREEGIGSKTLARLLDLTSIQSRAAELP
jgi:hypothetical protein